MINMISTCTQKNKYPFQYHVSAKLITVRTILTCVFLPDISIWFVVDNLPRLSLTVFPITFYHLVKNRQKTHFVWPWGTVLGWQVTSYRFKRQAKNISANIWIPKQLSYSRHLPLTYSDLVQLVSASLFKSLGMCRKCSRLGGHFKRAP